MRKKLLLIVVALLSTLILAVTVSAGRIVHSVHVGGPDLCSAFELKPGCDANSSLVVHEYADGSVSGQWTEQLGHGNGGFHVFLDCLSVSVDGDEAWISGVATHDTFSGDGSYVGVRGGIRVKDNGTSANDLADQISFLQGEEEEDFCLTHPDYELFDLPQGQVKVR